MRGNLNWGGSHRQYRRGAIMGLTIAEAFMLLVFALLLLFLLWRWDYPRILEALGDSVTPGSPEFEQQLEQLGQYSRFSSNESSGELIGHISQMSASDIKSLEELLGSVGASRTMELMSEATEAADQLELLSDPENREFLERFVQLPDPLKARLKELADSESLQDTIAAVDEARRLRRLVDSDSERRIAAAVSLLEPEEQLKLEDLVLSDDPLAALEFHSGIAELMQDGITMDAIREAIRNNDEIATKLATKAQAQVELANSINRSLGDVVSRIGGSIGPHGRVSLPNNVGFEQGNDLIRTRFNDFLGSFCPKFLEIMYSSRDEILEIRVEGHASSEWSESRSIEEAFLLNLDLSQRRAHNVLASCLDQAGDPGIRDWAGGRIAALGYSSSRPVYLEDGSEDKEGSRRVEFGYLVDYDSLLDDIRATVERDGTAAALPQHPPETIGIGN